MISSTSNKLREKISKKYLDLAELLPNCRIKTISTLKLIREYQRKGSDRVYIDSRIPEGVDFELFGLKIIEVFNLNNFENLQKGLKNIFKKNDGFFRRNYDFSDIKGKLTGGGWYKIGCLVKKRNFLIPNSVSFDLPNGIHSIDIELYRVLPSQYVLTFDVLLENSLKKEFKNLLNDRYLSSTIFKSILPWRISRTGYSQSNTESSIKAALKNWKNKIRSNVERCLSPHFKGIFYKYGHKSKPKLPCVELYLLKDNENVEIPFEEWKGRHKWLRTIGIKTYSSGSYKHINYLIIWPDRRDKITAPLKLLILENEVLKNIDIAGYGNDKVNAIYHVLYEEKESIISLFSLVAAIEMIQDQVENIRIEISNMRKSVTWRHKINKALDLNTQLRELSYVIHDFKNEYFRNKKWIEHRLEVLSQAKRAYNDDSDIRKDFIFMIDNKFDLIFESIQLLENSFISFIENNNIKVMLSLQQRMIWLTVIITLATILGVSLNYDKLLVIYRFLVNS